MILIDKIIVTFASEDNSPTYIVTQKSLRLF